MSNTPIEAIVSTVAATVRSADIDGINTVI